MPDPSELNGSTAPEGSLAPEKSGEYIFTSYRDDPNLTFDVDVTGCLDISIESLAWLLEMAGYKLEAFKQND